MEELESTKQAAATAKASGNRSQQQTAGKHIRDLRTELEALGFTEQSALAMGGAPSALTPSVLAPVAQRSAAEDGDAKKPRKKKNDVDLDAMLRKAAGLAEPSDASATDLPSHDGERPLDTLPGLRVRVTQSGSPGLALRWVGGGRAPRSDALSAADVDVPFEAHDPFDDDMSEIAAAEHFDNADAAVGRSPSAGADAGVASDAPSGGGGGDDVKRSVEEDDDDAGGFDIFDMEQFDHEATPSALPALLPPSLSYPHVRPVGGLRWAGGQAPRPLSPGSSL